MRYQLMSTEFQVLKGGYPIWVMEHRNKIAVLIVALMNREYLRSVEHGVSDSFFYSVALSHALQQFISNSVQMMLRQSKLDAKALGQHFQLDISQATRGNILPVFH
jgi:hypothetical protein